MSHQLVRRYHGNGEVKAQSLKYVQALKEQREALLVLEELQDEVNDESARMLKAWSGQKKELESQIRDLEIRDSQLERERSDLTSQLRVLQSEKEAILLENKRLQKIIDERPAYAHAPDGLGLMEEDDMTEQCSLNPPQPSYEDRATAVMKTARKLSLAGFYTVTACLVWWVMYDLFHLRLLVHWNFFMPNLEGLWSSDPSQVILYLGVPLAISVGLFIFILLLSWKGQRNSFSSLLLATLAFALSCLMLSTVVSSATVYLSDASVEKCYINPGASLEGTHLLTNASAQPLPMNASYLLLHNRWNAPSWGTSPWEGVKSVFLFSKRPTSPSAALIMEESGSSFSSLKRIEGLSFSEEWLAGVCVILVRLPAWGCPLFMALCLAIAAWVTYWYQAAKHPTPSRMKSLIPLPPSVVRQFLRVRRKALSSLDAVIPTQQERGLFTTMKSTVSGLYRMSLILLEALNLTSCLLVSCSMMRVCHP